MTITARVETEGHQLFVKGYLPEEKTHVAKPVGNQIMLDNGKFLSLAAAPSEHPPHPGGYMKPET